MNRDDSGTVASIKNNKCIPSPASLENKMRFYLCLQMGNSASCNFSKPVILRVRKGLVLGVLPTQVPPGMFRVKSYTNNILLDAVISLAGSKELAWDLANLIRTALICASLPDSLNVPHCAPARMTTSTVAAAVQAFKSPAYSSGSPWFFVLFPEQICSSLALSSSSHLSSWETVWVDLGKDQLLGKWAFLPPKNSLFFQANPLWLIEFLPLPPKNPCFLSWNFSCFLRALIPC